MCVLGSSISEPLCGSPRSLSPVLRGGVSIALRPRETAMGREPSCQLVLGLQWSQERNRRCNVDYLVNTAV